MAEFSDKVAVIIGGRSGIGAATAALLASRGCTVVAAGLRPEGPEAGAIPEVEQVDLDVRDEEAVRDVMDRTVGSHGGIDVVVPTAGIQRYGTTTETSSDAWRQVLDVNLTGAFLAVKYAVPHLRARGGGAIVIVSSVQAFITQRAVAAYTTSKGALNAFVRSVAIDEADRGIRANTVCPGSVDTPMLRSSARTFSDGTDAGEQAMVDTWGAMHPLGRVARPGEVAEAVAFLASDRASFISGVALPVDGGLLASAGVELPDTH